MRKGGIRKRARDMIGKGLDAYCSPWKKIEAKLHK